MIELLVVIAIIGILSGLIVVAMGGMTSSANIAKTQVFSNSLRNALMINMVGEWKFDSMSGTVGSTLADGTSVVDSWSNNNGTTSGGPTLKNGSDCVSGQCLSFDGNNDYINCGSGTSLNLTSAITVGAWIKTVSTAQQMIAYRGTDGSSQVWFLDVYTNKFRLGFANGHSFGVADIVYGNKEINDGKWHYVVATFNGNRMNTYIDGFIDDGKDKTTTPSSTNTTTFIGSAYGTSLYFNGSIDDMRVFSAGVPTSKIKEQYFAGLNKLLINGGISKEEYSLRINEVAIK